MESVAIVGGGMGGMAAALALGRSGHPVTVLERDQLPIGHDAEEAFLGERRGAPQVHQTHGFLARLQVVMRERFPDVFEELLARGSLRIPTTADLGEPQPGDEDLDVIITRRTTMDWVLRSAVRNEPSVDLRTGVTVTGLVAGGAPAAGASGSGGTPVVTGVRLDDGSVVEADMVVTATGRRDGVIQWLGDVGVEVPEEIHESGLMYLSRWYRLPEGFAIDQLDPKLGGDLGFVKYLGVPGDAGTLSITLAIRPDDSPLRRALSDADGFEEACRRLPGPDQFFRFDLRPLGGVRPMGGLLNRLRRFTTADGAPRVLGFHAIGDAHTCTNPLYGRGCSLAVVQAVALADAASEHAGDPAGRARAYESFCRAEVEPWFRLAVETDKMGADPAGLGLSSAGDGGDAPVNPLATIIVAAASDPVLGRGFARLWNLLATPEQLALDPVYTTRAAEVLSEPERYPLPQRDGPTRERLLAALSEPHAGGTSRGLGRPEEEGAHV